MRALVVAGVAALCVGCATTQPAKKDAPPPKPIASIAVVCNQSELQAVYVVLSPKALVRFSKESTVLEVIDKDGKVQQKALGPEDADTVLALAESASMGDVMRLDCGMKTSDDGSR